MAGLFCVYIEAMKTIATLQIVTRYVEGTRQNKYCPEMFGFIQEHLAYM
jgi:hypothetical protein